MLEAYLGFNEVCLLGALITVLHVTRFFNFTCSLISNLSKSCLDLLTKMVSSFRIRTKCF